MIVSQMLGKGVRIQKSAEEGSRADEILRTEQTS